MTDEDPLAWQTLDRRTSYTCEGFDVVTDTVRLPDGTETEYDHVTEGDSVVILPFLAPDAPEVDAGPSDGPGEKPDASDGPGEEPDVSDGPGEDPDPTVVLVEEWRQAVDRVNRGLPAGGIEPGEGPAAAARRELREETGHVAGELESLTVTEPANGLLDSAYHYFLARDCRPEAEQRLDRDESIRVTTAPLSAVRAAVASGETRDGRSALGVLYHQLHG